MEVTKEQLVNLANYLIGLAEASDEELIEMEREELERELYYNPKKEI